MSRYHVDTPARLELVRLALDVDSGLRTPQGAPVRVMHRIMRGGVQVGEIASDEYCARLGVEPTSVVPPMIIGDDGSAALEMPERPIVERCLGRTVNGTAIPLARDLVAEAQLPPRVRAEIARRRAQQGLEQAMGLGGGR